MMMTKDIKVVILCGGMGTRLKEETELQPKPMVRIGNQPMLWHIMKIYSHYGFKNFILCLGYKGEMIKDYFCNYHIFNSDFTVSLDKRKMQIHDSIMEDWSITLADTGVDALKGARVKRIQKYIDSDIFMLTYGDGVARINIKDLLNFHLSHGKIGTVTGVRPPSRFGEIKVEGGAVAKFTEKPQLSGGFINGGFFVFNRKFLDYLSEDDDCDLERGALEKLAKDRELMVYEFLENWECMDNVRDLGHLNKLWSSNQAFWKVW